MKLIIDVGSHEIGFVYFWREHISTELTTPWAPNENFDIPRKFCVEFIRYIFLKMLQGVCGVFRNYI
jgi:hypothetical protein